MGSNTDELLVQMAQNGCYNALCELIHRYERKTYSLAFRLMGNHADAADAAQEALIRIYSRIQHFKGNSAFSTWLFRVVTNTCLDELRRRNRLRHASLDDPLTTDEGEMFRHDAIATGDSPTDLAEQTELQAAVQRAISALPDDYRVVIVMRDIQDYSYQEIADLLGTSMGTIKSRLHRARLALRAILRTHEAKRLGIAG